MSTTSTRVRPGAPVVLLMHGEPSWCFLYRKMIPVLTAAGLRCVAPDLVGFGRSDKPTDRAAYTYARHVEWMRAALFDALDLRDVTLVGQDWGGLIGLRLVGEHPDRFARVVAANTFLPTGDQPPGKAFLNWQRFSQTVEDFDVGFVVGSGCQIELTPEVAAAYNAPFPDDSYKAGARQFPMLVPTSPDDPASAANREAWETLRKWEKPFLTAFSDQDPVTRGGERAFQREVPGCAVPPTPRSTHRKRRPLPARRLRRATRADRRELDRRELASPPSTSSHSSTRCARSRKPGCTTPPTRSIATATTSCWRSRRTSTPTGPVSTSAEVRARFARDLGYVTAKVGADGALFDEHDRILLVRRVDDDRWGLVAGWVDAKRDPRANGRARDRRGGRSRRPGEPPRRPVRTRGRRRRQSAQRRVRRVPLRRDRRRAPGPTPRSPRDRVAAIDDVDDWHHHHETLARAALETHWRRAVGANDMSAATELNLAEAVCLTLVALEPRHGWSIVKALAPDGEIGRVWSLSRPLTYRALDALASAELIEPRGLGAGIGPAAHDLARDHEGTARVAQLAAPPGRAPARHAHRVPPQDRARRTRRRARAGAARRVHAGLRRLATSRGRRSRTTSSPGGGSSRPRPPAASCNRSREAAGPVANAWVTSSP